ncbi:NAD-dependent epimerase/dehydratase family protein [Pseudomonas sp. M30-35]|uniref:NAD-dependent epimerase/dehydratase family protein n=1 Tax=Pseudomonas sp. M30-35 TaxID=1981174 RepID=UPI000B3C5CFC|nr:NAD-dependent epimerase/dehydratase family protein [Pseudomonas sp. M30-35]ARU88047.1 epimerase [Pseudomonas sp. M30-35]
MKILVTGGAGFIGSHLIKKILRLGHTVKVLDNLSPQIHGEIPQGLDWLNDSRIEFIKGSVTSANDWALALDGGVEAVVHLAAETGTGQSMYEVARYNEVNSQGTALLFDVLGKLSKSSVKRIVLSSSRSVYGEGAYLNSSGQRVFPSGRTLTALSNREWEPVCSDTGEALQLTPTLETDLVFPSSIYAATKYAQEDLVRIGCQSLGIEFAIFRLQNVYGQGQSLNNPYTGILSIFSTKIRRNSVLPLFEDGNESRDFVHVDDVTEALLQGLIHKQAPNTIINVGSGVATSVKTVAEELSLAFGMEPNLKITGQFRVGDIRHNYADISRLKSLLGVTPKISLAEGLKQFSDWVKTQPLAIDNLDKANQELRDRNLMS